MYVDIIVGKEEELRTDGKTMCRLCDPLWTRGADERERGRYVNVSDTEAAN